VIAVTDTDWQQTVIETDGLALVDAWASWCGPCRMLGPVLEHFSDISGVPVYGVNADDNPEFMREHSIMSIPTVLVYKDGEKVAQLTGALTYGQLLDALEPFKIDN
jgi:thioredoxin 1